MKLFRFALILSVALTAYCIIRVAFMSPWPVIGVAVVAWAVAAKRGYGRLTTLASARWADGEDLRRVGMLGGKGLILGRAADSRSGAMVATKALFDPRVDSRLACEQFLAIFRKPAEPLVTLSNAVHTAVFAPTGVGKGVSFVIPFLETCPDSCVVIDFKGELAKLTGDHRRDKFGHNIVILDPFKVVTQTPAKFNPLDSIDKENPLAIDECRSLADALVIRTGHEKEMHWTDSAEAWIASMLAVVVHYGEPEDRSLQTVRALLSNPAKMEAVIKLMCGATDVWDGMLARMGQQLTHYKDKELGSTMTTTNRFLRFLDTLAILDSTKSSSFNPAELCKGKTTVYLVLPPEHMRAQSALLRMWIGSMLRAVVRGGLQEKTFVHFVLDEAASLGHLEALDDAVDKYRGYGVRLQFYYQSLGQLKRCFPEGQDQTLLSNTTQVFFGCNDPQTAEYVSNRLGEETIIVTSGGTSSGTSHQKTQDQTTYSHNRNDNWAQQVRKLLKPEEVAALSARIAITFTPGIPPLWTNLLKYFEEPNLGRELTRWERWWSSVKIATRCVAALILAIGLVYCVAKIADKRTASNVSASR